MSFLELAAVKRVLTRGANKVLDVKIYGLDKCKDPTHILVRHCIKSSAFTGLVTSFLKQ